jgi:hypothetical protein
MAGGISTELLTEDMQQRRGAEQKKKKKADRPRNRPLHRILSKLTSTKLHEMD